MEFTRVDIWLSGIAGCVNDEARFGVTNELDQRVLIGIVLNDSRDRSILDLF